MRELLFLKGFNLEIFVGFDYSYSDAAVKTTVTREVDGFTFRHRCLVVILSKMGVTW